jgi:predicted nucleic acid-binding protein
LNGELPIQKNIEAMLLNKNFSISALTLSEILSWKMLSEADVEAIILALDGVEIISVSERISIKAASLRRKHSIKLADAIISATAICGNYTLATYDLYDFKQIADLTIIHPYKVK